MAVLMVMSATLSAVLFGASANAAPPAGGGYHAVNPARILDTRNAIGVAKGSLAPSSTLHLQVTDVGGVPSTGVLAVVMNVTAVDPTSAGYLTVWPQEETRPNASNLNFARAQNVPNLVTVKVGPSGKVSFYNAFGNTHVLADVVGWYDDGTTPGGRFNPLTSTRIIDTRTSDDGPKTIGPGATLDAQITGRGGVPETGVSAVVINITVADASSSGYLTVFPQGTARPEASNLNFERRPVTGNAVTAIANLVTVGVNQTNGKISIYNAFGDVAVIGDVLGWYDIDGTEGSVFVPLNPVRALDTRPGDGLHAGETGTLTVTGGGGIPESGVSAIVANVTATNTTSAGYLVVWPDGVDQPYASNLNWAAASTVPNLVVTPVSANGDINIFNIFGYTDVLVDIVGYFLSPVV